MNLKFTLPLLFIVALATAQAPVNYYSTATGTGYTLKTQLKEIIDQHQDRGYGALYDAYEQGDTDKYYENDGTLLDMYSENPDENDPYNFNHNQDNCGSNGYKKEGDCYNREHLFPQGTFNKQSPMKNDYFHVVPSDGKVNSIRGNYPFGEVVTPSTTSANGSKVGPNTTDGYTETVFEPIDEFKGDVARAMLYFAVRYEDNVGSFKSHAMTDGASKHQFYATWFVDLLKKWHKEDPVVQRDLDRNEAGYAHQGNRNPFIDHPEWVELIWDGTEDIVEPDPDPKPVTGTIILEEDFENCGGMIFNVISEASDKNWLCETNNSLNGIGSYGMNGYKQDTPSKDWLISKSKVQFSTIQNAKINIETESTFGETVLKIMSSTDYDGSDNPSSFTWNDVLEMPHTSGSSEQRLNFEDESITNTEDAYIAIFYDGEQAPSRFVIDNVVIHGTAVSLGVHAIVDESSMIMYPNPSSEYLFIKTSNPYSYNIYSLKGESVLSKVTVLSNDKIDISSLPSGTYFVLIQSEGKTYRETLVVE